MLEDKIDDVDIGLRRDRGQLAPRSVPLIRRSLDVVGFWRSDFPKTDLLMGRRALD